MTIAAMTSRGRITVPAAMRAKLRVGHGSKIDVVENEAGEIVLRPVADDVRRLRGTVTYAGSPVSVESMNRAIGEAAAGSSRRSSS